MNVVTSMEDEDCPQCGILFRTSPNFRKMTESCGHVMCRHCAIISQDGCNQCKLNGPPPYNMEVEVKLTETPTHFMFFLPSELDLIQYPAYASSISVNNPNTFIFTYSDPEESTTIPTSNESNVPLPIGTGSSRDRDPLDPTSLEELEDEIILIDDSVVQRKSNASTMKEMKSKPPSLIPYFITTIREDPPLYQCNICQRKFTTRAHINYHVFCKKGDGGKPYKCKYDQCGKKFFSKTHYEYHLRTHRTSTSTTRTKQFMCHCGKGFHKRSTLAVHKRSHTKRKRRTFKRPDLQNLPEYYHRPFPCSYCEKRFLHRKDYKMHLMVHIDHLPFKCSICGLASKLKHGLTKHIINVHGQLKEVAEKLANDAGLEYLKETLKDGYPQNIPDSKIHSIVISTALKNSNLILPNWVVTDADFTVIRKKTACTQTQTKAGSFDSLAQTNYFTSGTGSGFISNSFTLSGSPPPSSSNDQVVNPRNQPSVGFDPGSEIEIVTLD